MQFTRKAVFAKAASIRGATQEIVTILDELPVHSQRSLKEDADAIGDLRKEVTHIDRIAATLQELDDNEAATLPERLAFLAVLFHRADLIHTTYIKEKVLFALTPTRRLDHLRGALDRDKLAQFDAMLLVPMPVDVR